jgi:hypothetical protein
MGQRHVWSLMLENGFGAQILAKTSESDNHEQRDTLLSATVHTCTDDIQRHEVALIAAATESGFESHCQ